MSTTPLAIEVSGAGEVSALWQTPVAPSACLVLAHGAGAGMTHRSMVAIADGLEALGVATLRYQFPYMEKGGRRPDGPAIAHAAVRAAVAEARNRAEGAPLFAGGRSFGGRMTSQAQALAPLAGVRGLVFFAFPLHPAGKPSVTRAEHLADVGVPMLFVQGSNDALAQLDLLRQTLAGLNDRATLDLIDDADHAFHVPARTGRKDPEVLTAMLTTAAQWMAAQGPGPE
ncbi:alpha/beta family hydrolase [Phenylobacterium sp.]|uniref:alpha/beta hydrolase family protein n=1 Tax=Phenylobacterium sp. TaxID=1871053 RepID=UPI001214F877|nr:alpha/beta family hydrolase [Phenylobacterium sp.]THD60808.1 MAG: alpha/beta hydrolase [Phenylobacterium sp.]